MKKIKLQTIILLIIFALLSQETFAAPPTSSSFILNDYGFGAGGVATSSSTNFLMQGIAGELETASLSSANYLALPGLTYNLEANVPGAPTFTNSSNYYNKLHLTVDNQNNPSDVTFLIQVSSGSANFTSDVYYVQADNTLGTTQLWQTYSSWGSSSGFDMIGLTPGTTYYARVKAKSGVFQEGSYGASANATTVIPSLTFDIDTTSQSNPPFSVAIGTLTAGNVTTSSDKVTITISTNATNGGLIYLLGTNNGLKSTTAGNYNIGSVSNNLTSISEGYGARGTTVTQSSGGPMELISPYNGAGNNVGIIDTSKRPLADSTGTPVTSGQATFELKAKPSNTTPAATDYSDILTVLATGSF